MPLLIRRMIRSIVSMKQRNLLQNVVHTFVGARAATGLFAEHPQLRYPASNAAANNYGNIHTNLLKEAALHKIVFCGEIHSRPPIVAMQQALLQEMAATTIRTNSDNTNNNNNTNTQKVHVVMEHVSFEMQPLLDEYQHGSCTFEKLVQNYKEFGTEGHDLMPYEPLFQDILEMPNVHLHAGFLSRRYARMLLKEDGGIEQVQQQVENKEWLPYDLEVKLKGGSDLHYNIFEGLITGRPITSGGTSTCSGPPQDRSLQRIFQAQLLKDVACAHKINQLVQQKGNESDKFLVIAGNGHLLYYCGIPERVLEQDPELAQHTCLVMSQRVKAQDLEQKEYIREMLKDTYPEGSNPCDYLYLYVDNKEEEEEEEVDTQWVKAETKKAYDKVGQSAHLEGNAQRAYHIMTNMGYTEAQIQVAGPEVYNFQGVGNPHIHGKIKSGERVLDVGSGLGIDSVIARHAAGPDGKVVGIDMAPTQVRHAQARADDRELDIQFVAADMEEIPVPDETFDVVISNGAFCLAPNKEKALAEIFRVLKPGGRISICTTTTKVDDLEPGVTWPLCMKMFMPMKEVLPMCERVGYTDVVVDDSDGSMSMELPLLEEVMENDNPDRNKVHVGSSDFGHLEDYDMDELCTRVCIVARKPSSPQ